MSKVRFMYWGFAKLFSTSMKERGRTLVMAQALALDIPLKDVFHGGCQCWALGERGLYDLEANMCICGVLSLLDF